MFKHRYLENVATLQLNPEKCIGCGRCLEVCPHAVFKPADGKVAIQDLNSCMECGACKLNCPVSAISVSQGVGCAAAIIHGMMTGGEPSCDCSGDNNDSCC